MHEIFALSLRSMAELQLFWGICPQTQHVSIETFPWTQFVLRTPSVLDSLRANTGKTLVLELFQYFVYYTKVLYYGVFAM